MFHNWFWGGGMWFGWIFWLAIIGIIVYLLVNQSSRNRNQDFFHQPSSDTPIDIIKKRYAKGEITKEQFDQMRKDLE
jgi:putative membrane protein